MVSPSMLVLVQYDLGNYVVLVVSLAFVCMRSSQHLHPARPPQKLMSAAVLAPIALFMGFYAVEQGIAVAILNRQSWYHPETSKVC